MRRHWERPEYKSHISCPLCSGDSGYYYIWSGRFKTFMAWDGVIEDSSEPSEIYTGKLRCVDCNKIVEKYIESIELAQKED